MTYKHRIAIIGADTLAREIAVLCSENGAGKVFALDSDPKRLAEMARAGAWVKLGNPASERVLRDFLREAQARYVFYLSRVGDQDIIEGNEQAIVKLNVISPLNALRYASGVRAASFIYVTDTRGEEGGMRLFECAEAALCASVPVMGINLGHFGFLVETQRDEWQFRIDDLLTGNWETDKRMMIYAEHYRGEKKINSWEVLNDIVLARALSLRPIHLIVHINDVELAEYVADGLILSTATGSTSYSQSVGGPILRPDMRNMLLTPISPNLCVDRSLVLPDTDTVSFMLTGRVDALISPDGYEGGNLGFDDRVCARASEHSAEFVRFEDKGVFYRNITRYMQRNPTIKGEQRS